MGRHKFWEGIWEITCVGKDGKVKWQEEVYNALANQGEMNLLDTFFRLQNAPTEFYLRLCYDTLAETDTLSVVQNEASGFGYAPQVVERSLTGFPVLELDAGDYRVITKQVSFTAAGGDIGPFNTLYLATTSDNSGLLIGFIALSIERTVLSGDTMLARLRIKLK